jgi:hypothetical protein
MSDELDRVRRFRSEEAAPSDAVRERARSALRNVTANPAASTERHRAGKSRDGGRRRYGWLPRSVAVGLVLAGCFVAIELLGSGTGTGPSPALAATLGRLARIAANGPSLVPGPGQYLYVDSDQHYSATASNGGAGCVTYALDHRQVWIAADGSGLMQDTIGQSTYTSVSDREVCAKMHLLADGVPGTSRTWFAGGCFEISPVADMQSLSTNPRRLLGEIGGSSSPGAAFEEIGDLLRETDASPSLRAALYRAAALIPGVHLLGTVRDHIGRTGLGVTHEDHGITDELIFNARTSALVGEQQSGQGPGTDGWAAYITSRVVSGLPRQSPLPLTPPCVGGAGVAKHTPEGTVDVGQ